MNVRYLPLVLSVFLAASAGSQAAELPVVSVVQPQVANIRITTQQPVTLEPYYTADLGARVSGVVKAVPVEIGDVVERGALLAELAVPELDAQRLVLVAELGAAEASVEAALAHRHAVQAEADRILNLVGQGSVTEKVGEEARKKRAVADAEYKGAVARLDAKAARLVELDARIGFASIRAPFAGVVSHRGVDPGDLIEAEQVLSGAMPLIQVVQTDVLRAVTYVPEKDTPLLTVGDAVTFEWDALKGLHTAAEVSRLSHVLDSKTQRMRVEADVVVADNGLRAGFYGMAEIVLDELKGALTIPAQAVRFAHGSALVYLVRDGKIVHQPIEIGVDRGQWVEVKAGLSGGEQVVVGGIDRLAAGTQVAVR